jgi:hypothetical protein
MSHIANIFVKRFDKITKNDIRKANIIKKTDGRHERGSPGT